MSAWADSGPSRAFLGCPTPDAWLQAASRQVDILLLDHANCEKKAAATALGMLHRYPERPRLLREMARLAREELRHFDQALKALRDREVPPRRLSPSRYAAALFRCAARSEPTRLADTLIVGAIIEARSCERFALLAERLEGRLASFYAGLAAAEARHFETYLRLARRYAEGPIERRIAEMLATERRLVLSPDTELRFHSGPPAAAAPALAVR